MSKILIGPQTLVYPMPTFLIGANVDNKPNFMTVAWGGYCQWQAFGEVVAKACSIGQDLNRVQVVGNSNPLPSTIKRIDGSEH